MNADLRLSITVVWSELHFVMHFVMGNATLNIPVNAFRTSRVILDRVNRSIRGLYQHSHPFGIFSSIESI